MRNSLNPGEKASLKLLLDQLETPNELHPLQCQYISDKINLFDYDEGILETLLKLNQASGRMAECLTLPVSKDMRQALLTDIKLMSTVFDLLHSFKARPYIMS